MHRRPLRFYVLLGPVAVGSLVLAVLAGGQNRRLTRRIEELSRASRRLGKGDFPAAMPRSGVPEIDDVALALESTSGRMAAMLRAERQFSSNAGHQLRSALTGVSLRVEALCTHQEADVQQVANEALEQITRVSETIDELLLLAQTGQVGERRAVDLVELARQHVEDFRPGFSQAERRVRFTAPKSAPAVATPGALGQALDVLLDNALKHGAGYVNVNVRASARAVEVNVSDEGGGIEDAVVKRLFTREVVDGHGIGLPLARLLVETDGGSLELVDPKTATFRMRIPVDPDLTGS